MRLALCDDTGTPGEHGVLVDPAAFFDDDPTLSEPLPGPGWPLYLVSHLREHLVWMRLRGLAERTLFCRRRAVVSLAEWLGADPIAATPRQLHTWQVHLLRTSRAHVRHQTALVRPYYSWLQAAGYRGDNPAALLPIPRKRRGLPRPIAENRLAEVLMTARPRLLPWFLLAGWSGLRAAEIAERRVDDFFTDPHGHWVRVLGKGEVVRHAPIPDWIWPTMQASLAASGLAWRRERGFGPVSAKSVSDLCNDHLRECGFDDTLHALRHRAATLAYEDGGRDLRLVQEFLGHLHADTTAIYTRVSPQRMAAAVGALPQLPLPTPPGVRHLHVVDERATGGTA